MMLRNLAASTFLLMALTVGLSSEVSTSGSDLPSDQRVLAFLTEAVDWYHQLAVEREISTDSGDVVFIENNRALALQILQLAFDFAKAKASVSTARNQVSGAIAVNTSPDLHSSNAKVDLPGSLAAVQFFQQQAMLERASLQAGREIDGLGKKLLVARGAERRTLQAALDATQSRVELLQAALASLREVIEFVQTSDSRHSGDLPSSIDDLERTIPELTNRGISESQTRSSDSGTAARSQDFGIVSLTSKVSALNRKLRILDERIDRTEKLKRSCKDLHDPLLAYLHQRVLVSTESNFEASDLAVLQQQKAQIDGLRVMVKALAPAVVALDKQNVLLDAYSSHLKSWRAVVSSDDEKIWKHLSLRLCGVAVGLVSLVLIGAVALRVTERHLRDAERRHLVRLIVRLVVWLAIVLVIAFSFASDLTSLATFFGLLTAVLAVALQSVIREALGYLVLVGKRGIRIGDRVHISGVTGEVSDMGWLQFQLREIDAQTQQPTGNVVTFSNSFIFVCPATGLTKSSRED